MILIWIIMIIYCLLPLTIIFSWHIKTIKKYWRPLLVVNLVIIALSSLADNFATRNQIWHITFDQFSATPILGTQLGNLIWYTVITFILSVITILMWNARQTGVHFRTVFIKNGNPWYFFILIILATLLVFASARLMYN